MPFYQQFTLATIHTAVASPFSSVSNWNLDCNTTFVLSFIHPPAQQPVHSPVPWTDISISMTLPASYLPTHSAMSPPYAWGVLSKYTSDHVIALSTSDATQTPEHSIQGLGTTIWFGFTQDPFPSLFCKHILTHHRLRWQVTQVEVNHISTSAGHCDW